MPTKCRLCSSSNTELLFVSENIHGRHLLGREKFNVLECKKCKVTFTDVDVNSFFYSHYYPKNYYDKFRGSKLVSNLLDFLEKFSFQRKLRLILKHKSSGNRVLEIGCAQGNFLNNLPSFFEKFGVEINENGRQYIQEHYPNITVYQGDIESESFGDYAKKYDIILMWHVLEHIQNPSAFLKRLSSILNKNGVFIFEVPNRDSLGFRLTRKQWFHLDTPRHLYHFNQRSLKHLLNQQGLKIIEYSGNTIDYWHDLTISICKCFSTKVPIINKMFYFMFFPIGFIIRTLLSMFIAHTAEINTYVVKHSS
jgi:2-polyprenyl-3-methyl-5-hydroxy-6-metoxy-1,4-benzoquinol methylase